MEEEIEQFLANETLEESWDPTSNEHIHQTVIFTAGFIGLICDLILIAAICTNKRLQNRANQILTCFLALDFCNQLVVPFLFTNFDIEVLRGNRLACIIFNSDTMFQYFEELSMAMLLSDFVVNTKRISDRALMYGFVSTLLSIIFVLVIMCAYNVFLDALMMTFIITSMMLFIATVAKDGYSWWRAISDEAAFRLNLVRIYIYIKAAYLMIIFITRLQYSPIPTIGYAIQLLTSAFLLIYIYRSDSRFKISIMNLFRRSGNKYNVDAGIGFIEDFNNQEEAKVVVDINRSV